HRVRNAARCGAQRPPPRLACRSVRDLAPWRMPACTRDDAVITAETVNRVVGFRGNGMPVISLYAVVPCEPQDRGTVVRSKVDSLVHEIRPMAQDHQLDNDVMLSVRAD